MLRPPNNRSFLKALATGACAAVVLAACSDDPPAGPVGGGTSDPILSRYVAIGNSLTAGVQSNGLNDSLQMLAYPVLLAQQMGLTIGTDFIVPLLAGNGCAPPYENVFTQQRVNGGASSDCGGRVDARVPHNLGIPGARLLDAVSVTGPRAAPNIYTTLFAGDQAPLTVAASLNPTFMSVWLGNNDALAAAIGGDLAPLTSHDDFTQDLDLVLEAMDSMDLQGAILIGAVQVINAPNLSPAAAYWVGSQMASLPPTLTVSGNCATTAAGGAGEATLVPFAYGFGLIAQATAGANVTLDCLTDPRLLHLPEIATLVGAVARFNTVIERAAADRGWAYLDPNPIIDSVKAAGAGGITLFPNTSGIDALLRPFGSFISRDGVHPSSIAQRVVTDHIINAINAVYNLGIPNLP